jgi:membrane peptidoglycan carboxypeptidase
VTTPNGEVKFQLNPKPVVAFTKDISDTVSYALQRVVQYGTGTAALALGRPAAGKTGTTDDNKSAWFAGYTPDLATAVMFVKDGPDGNPISLSGTGGMASVYGGSFPARIWTSYMQGALTGMPVRQLPPLPPNVYSGAYVSPSASPSAPKPSATATARVTATASSTPTSQPGVRVPNLFGDIDTARATAANLGVGLNEVQLDESVDLTLPLYVVGQSPSEGSTVPVGSTITVQVSNSPN